MKSSRTKYELDTEECCYESESSSVIEVDYESHSVIEVNYPSTERNVIKNIPFPELCDRTNFRKAGLFDSVQSHMQRTSTLGGSFMNSLDLSTMHSRANTIFNPPLTEVTSQLFFGCFEDAKNKAELRARGITHILSVIGQKHPLTGFKHKQIPMNDYGRTDLKQVLKKLSLFFEESQVSGSALFIHCLSGQNRSATVMLALLMKSRNLRLEEAFRIVKKKRPVVHINEMYAKQLAQIEQELFGSISVPDDWMEICSYDMVTGSVVFTGENLSTPNLQTVRQFNFT